VGVAVGVAVLVAVAVEVAVAVDVAVAVMVGVAVAVAVSVAVSVAVEVAVAVSVAVALAVVVSVAVAVAVAVSVALAVAVLVAVAVSVAVAVAVEVAVAVVVAVSVAVAVVVAVSVAVAVAVEVAVGVAVRVAVMVGVGVAPNSTVVKNELKPDLKVSPSRALTVPKNLTLYLVLIASAPIGTKVAVSPSQKTLIAGTLNSLTASSRKLLVFTVLQSIGMSKTTVMEVTTGTSRSPSGGVIETTVGRGLSLAAAAPVVAAIPTKPMIATKAAVEKLLTIYFSRIAILLIEDMAFISLLAVVR
jgi:hypothetical protein